MAGALSPILGGKVLIGSWQSTGVQIVVHAHRSVWQPRQPERSKVPLRRTRAVRASFLPTNHRYMRERAGNGFSPSPSFLMSRRPRRPLFVPGSAEARVAVKVARFRTAFVQLRACGVLRTACDNPASPPLPWNGHRGRHWGGLTIERTSAMTNETNNSPPTLRVSPV